MKSENCNRVFLIFNNLAPKENLAKKVKLAVWQVDWCVRVVTVGRKLQIIQNNAACPTLARPLLRQHLSRRGIFIRLPMPSPETQFHSAYFRPQFETSEH